jgi:hypothetical protein
MVLLSRKKSLPGTKKEELKQPSSHSAYSSLELFILGEPVSLILALSRAQWHVRLEHSLVKVRLLVLCITERFCHRTDLCPTRLRFASPCTASTPYTASSTFTRAKASVCSCTPLVMPGHPTSILRCFQTPSHPITELLEIHFLAIDQVYRTCGDSYAVVRFESRESEYAACTPLTCVS